MQLQLCIAALHFTDVIGGLIFAMANNDDGKIHNPSPQIKPDATAGIINVARLELILCQTNTIRVPKHISIAKLAPIRKGAAMAIGNGTHLPYFSGKRSLIKLATTANPKNP